MYKIRIMLINEYKKSDPKFINLEDYIGIPWMKIKLELERYDDGNETNESSYFARQGQKKEILREPYGNWSILKLITITLDCSYIAVMACSF